MEQTSPLGARKAIWRWAGSNGSYGSNGNNGSNGGNGSSKGSGSSGGSS